MTPVYPDLVPPRPSLARITIENLTPVTPTRRFPAKSVVGDKVTITADIYADGHDRLAARLRWRPKSDRRWRISPLRELHEDVWSGKVEPDVVGAHDVVVEAWRDRFATWRHDIEIKVGVGDDVTLELEEGARLLEKLAKGVDKALRPRVFDAVEGLRRDTCSLHVRLNAGLDDQVADLVAGVPDADVTTVALPLWVDRPRAEFGAWYELFPRSEGGLAKATERLEAVAAMGFDIVYLPPIHPIGTTARKGPDNTLVAGPDDPGSPWGIGSPEGGHTAVHPDLGTLEDLHRFCAEAAEHGMEVALDYALQCSPDHPWVSEHPEWFHQRPDGSIRYAENPPKKYQDIFPINFWPAREPDRAALWDACLDVLRHWIAQGIRVFRVDNPHTKPMAFWAWVIGEVHRDHPDVLFLSEAFTRPRVMAKLAEVGFTQSYTYFTWRDTAAEMREYVEELAYGPASSYMRPNFWPNTPDILPDSLWDQPPAAFRARLVLAATLVPSYGIYNGFELYENERLDGAANTEYLHSEKYEIRERDWDRPDSLAPYIAKVNEARRRHPAMRRLRNIRFHHSDNGNILVWSKGHAHDSDDGRSGHGDLVLVVVNFDPHNAQETVLGLDLGAMGLPAGGRYFAHDELTGETYTWDGPNPYVRLDPVTGQVAHILSLRA
jgi:starch synthase (maltosyl-transferring)